MSTPEPYSPLEPNREWTAPTPAVPVGRGVGRVGQVTGALTRQEGSGPDVRGVTVTSFRLVDPQTGVPTEVELRGRSVVGTVRDGDWVEVPGAPGRSGRLEPLLMFNLTTRSEVVVKGRVRSTGATVAVALIVLVLVLVIPVIIGVVLMASS